MKKFLMGLAFASISMTGFAQTDVPVEKYSVSTNSFWSNWFIQANVAYTAFYNGGENFNQSPLKDFRRNLGASLAIGKWFTPGIGLRTKVNGIWGRSVMTEDPSRNASKYWVVNEQVLFNLNNLFCGYNERRVWNLIPYFGGGIGRNMTHNSYAMGLNAGLLNMFRVSKHIAINLDISYGVHDPDFDGVSGMIKNEQHEYAGGNRTNLKSRDRDLNVEVGLTFNLGKATWNKTPDVEALKALSQAQIDALNAQLNDANAEVNRLNNVIKNHKCPEQTKPVTVKEVVAAPVSVFFNIGKSRIASRKDLQNVKELAEVAKANCDAKIVVTGYADSKTGSASYNQKLSQKRAEAVANELVKMGISRDKIEVVAAGGVNTLSPISYNRRATVAVK